MRGEMESEREIRRVTERVVKLILQVCRPKKKPQMGNNCRNITPGKMQHTNVK